MKSDVYLTPPEWISLLGPFDMDPCCPPDMPWPTATRMVTKEEDGLKTEWRGRVWLNPPFGQEAAAWLWRLTYHRNGIALIPARTETDSFRWNIWNQADAVLFVIGRPHFYAAYDTEVTHNGKRIHVKRGERFPFNSGAPITLAAFGDKNVESLRCSKLGVFINEWEMVA